MKSLFLLTLNIAVSALLFKPCHAAEPVKKSHAILLAGNPSHGPGAHEHNAGVLLLKKCLDESGLPIHSTAFLNNSWPTDIQRASADTFVIYCDGGPHHLILKENRLQELSKEIQRGAGLVCLHYAVEIPKDKGGSELTEWMGGYFEENWSVNPHWLADYPSLPRHPISNGVSPFGTQDEWYFHMRFADPKKGKRTNILSAIAPDSTMSRKDGPHEGNPTVRQAVANKIPQTTAWAFQRKNGGRGFGFTGGHFHQGWGNDNQRKLVLNAIVWTANAHVPESGVPSTVTEEDLKKNLDEKGRKKK